MLSITAFGGHRAGHMMNHDRANEALRPYIGSVTWTGQGPCEPSMVIVP